MNFQKLLVESLVWRGFYFFTLLLVNVFLSRYLQAPGAGWVYYLSNIFSFSVIIVSVSLEAGVTYFSSGKIIERHRLISLTLGWSVVVTSVVIVAVFVYLFFWGGSLPVSQQQLYYFGICYITGLFLTNCGAALFYAENNFFLPNFLLTIWNIFLIIIIPKKIVAKDLLHTGYVLNVYFLIFFLQGISICITYIIKNKNFINIKLPTGNEVKNLFKYSAVAMMANIVFFLVYRIDYLFVNASAICTAGDLGNYIQVSKLGQMLLIIPQIIASVIFPRTASGIDRKELNDSLMIIARLFMQLYLIILIIISFWGKQLFTWLFGVTFNEMQIPFIILIPGIFSLSVLNLLSAYFGGKGKVNVNVTGAVLALIVVIIGDYFFVPMYGIIAAAAVSTVGYTVNVGYSLYVFYKDYNINLINFFLWRKGDYLWLKTLIIKKVD